MELKKKRKRKKANVKSKANFFPGRSLYIPYVFKKKIVF